MKKLRYILPAALLAVALCSCDVQIDDKFSDDAQSRLAQVNALNLKNLQSASNGWVMEYYPHPTRSYGGFTILVRFDSEGYCYMINDRAQGFSPDYQRKSEYRVVSDQSSVLSFCTLNPYIHEFADPGTTEGDGVRYGYRGDFEFAIKSSSETEIVLQGIKTGNIIRMSRFPEEASWEEYLMECTRVDREMNIHLFSGYAVTVDGAHVGDVSVKSYPVLIMPDPVEGNPEQKKQVAFKYTTTGIRLYEPASIGGATIDELELSEDGTQFTGRDGNREIVFTGTYVEGFIPFNDYLGTWDFHSTFQYIVDLEITIEEKEHNRMLVMKGFPYGLEAPVVYNRETGTLSIANNTETGCTVPVLNTNTNQTVYCPVHMRVARGTTNNSTARYGLIAENSEEDGKLRIDWKDNGYWYAANPTEGGARGFGFYYISPMTGNAARAAGYQDIIMIKKD